MNELIGVKAGGSIIDVKRELLFFDRIAWPDIEDKLRNFGNIKLFNKELDLVSYRRDIENLLNAETIFIPNRYDKNTILSEKEYGIYCKIQSDINNLAIDKLKGINKQINKHMKDFEAKINTENDTLKFAELLLHLYSKDEIKEQGIDNILEALRLLSTSSDYEARLISLELRNNENLRAVPIIQNITNLDNPTINDRWTPIVKMVIRNLPIPNEKTTFQDIFEFRNDSNIKADYFALRKWISDMSRSELSLDEVEDTIKYLNSQFQRHMKIYRNKFDIGSVETLLITTAEVLENIVKFQWSKAIKALFSIYKRESILLEEELKAPGREIAYITKTTEIFT